MWTISEYSQVYENMVICFEFTCEREEPDTSFVRPKGDGSEGNPFQITNVGELYWFAGFVNETITADDITVNPSKACAKLMNDITVNYELLKDDGTVNGSSGFAYWIPIGFYSNYSGTFDGQNHTISNAKIAYEGTEKAALFSGRNRGVFNVTVKNIHVTAPNIVSGSAGILCSDPNASIDNVTILNSSVKGGKYTGGVAGYNYGGVTNSTVKNCSISGRYKTGGIIGYICNSNNESKQVNGNTLDTVNVVVEDLLSGKQPVVGQVVGNWNCSNGECRNNTITNVTGATEKIGQIESNCIAGLVQD